jgi:hypothetical protein
MPVLSGADLCNRGGVQAWRLHRTAGQKLPPARATVPHSNREAAQIGRRGGRGRAGRGRGGVDVVQKSGERPAIQIFFLGCFGAPLFFRCLL